MAEGPRCELEIHTGQEDMESVPLGDFPQENSQGDGPRSAPSDHIV